MTFALRAKQDLCGINIKKECCRKAQLYGMLLFAANYGTDRIRLITESEGTRELAVKLLREVFHIEPNLYITEKKHKDDDGHRIKSSKITVSARQDAEKIIGKFKDGNVINAELFACEGCRAAFLRGAFLSAGKMNNPDGENHLEISAKCEKLAQSLQEQMEAVGVTAKVGKRADEYIVYMKSGAQIENFLAYIGASDTLFELMNSRIVKEAKNDANRQRNCDTANLGRTVSAAGVQINSIRTLIESGRIELLPKELKETALLRLEYPELSIKDFAEVFKEPISKSGVNHRLKKIMDFAQNKDSGEI